MEIQVKKLKDLKPNPLNPRKSSITQDENLKKSLEKFGVVEPIVFNRRSGYIVGGHFRVRELKKLGYKEVECVIVDLNEQDEKELLIRLNANTGDWDTDLLLQDWDADKLADWGVDISKSENDEEYTTKVESPVYTPKKEKPNEKNLYDLTKYEELKNEIKNSDISIEEKQFLLEAAKRHIVFNYAEIAEYYAHSSKKVQELMENSALVIIDYNKAIEKGFVKLYDSLTELSEIDE
jgi:hypothetical protein